MIHLHRWREREGTEGRALTLPGGFVFQVTRHRGVLTGYARCGLGSVLVDILPERLDKRPRTR